jgi:hypothetical protein
MADADFWEGKFAVMVRPGKEPGTLRVTRFPLVSESSASGAGAG